MGCLFERITQLSSQVFVSMFLDFADNLLFSLEHVVALGLNTLIAKSDRYFGDNPLLLPRELYDDKRRGISESTPVMEEHRFLFNYPVAFCAKPSCYTINFNKLSYVLKRNYISCNTQLSRSFRNHVDSKILVQSVGKFCNLNPTYICLEAKTLSEYIG